MSINAGIRYFRHAVLHAVGGSFQTISIYLSISTSVQLILMNPSSVNVSAIRPEAELQACLGATMC